MTRNTEETRGRRHFWKLVVVALLVVSVFIGLPVVWPGTMKVVFNDAPDGLITLEPWIVGLDSPIDVAPVPDGSGRSIVVERAGLVRMIDPNGTIAVEPVLDLSDLVDTSGEGGMLAVAFHPGFAGNPKQTGSGLFYVSWTSHDAVLTVSEFVLPPRSDVVKEAGRIILEVPQYSDKHHGGDLEFGTDGYLYVSVGDGSDSRQQRLEAQSLESLLGKILRIDVNQAGPDGQPYGIPSDNPFLDNSLARPEIFAVGFRNPWRITFHAGALWVGDVGGQMAEEVNLIAPGGNYGWPVYEGNKYKFLGAVRHVAEGRIGEYIGAVMRMNFSSRGRRIPPIAAYDHDAAAAIIGGVFVDEAAGLGDIAGRYLFADFVRGTISSVEYDDGLAVVTLLADTSESIVAFGHHSDGRILVVSITGTIFRLTTG